MGSKRSRRRKNLLNILGGLSGLGNAVYEMKRDRRKDEESKRRYDEDAKREERREAEANRRHAESMALGREREARISKLEEERIASEEANRLRDDERAQRAFEAEYGIRDIGPTESGAPLEDIPGFKEREFRLKERELGASEKFNEARAFSEQAQGLKYLGDMLNPSEGGTDKTREWDMYSAKVGQLLDATLPDWQKKSMKDITAHLQALDEAGQAEMSGGQIRGMFGTDGREKAMTGLMRMQQLGKFGQPQGAQPQPAPARIPDAKPEQDEASALSDKAMSMSIQNLLTGGGTLDDIKSVAFGLQREPNLQRKQLLDRLITETYPAVQARSGLPSRQPTYRAPFYMPQNK